MGLYKRENGVFYLSLTINKKRIYKSLQTKNQSLANDLYAIYLKETFLSSLFKGSSHILEKEKKAKTITITQHYNKYLDFCISREQGKPTLEDKKRFLKLLNQHKITTFQDIDSKKIEHFFSWAKNNYQHDSVRKYVAYLKAFLNYCIKQGTYSSENYHRLNLPQLTTKVRDKIYSPTQWQEIKERSQKDRDLHLYLEVLYFTGCRPNEIVNLKSSDIAENGLIKIYQSKVKKYKYVGVPPMILERLRQFDDKVFEGFGKHIEFYSKKFRRIKLAMGLNKDYTLYTFRHTFATNLLNKTSDIHLVSKALGHSNIMITSKHYANRSTKDIQDRVSVLWSD